MIWFKFDVLFDHGGNIYDSYNGIYNWHLIGQCQPTKPNITSTFSGTACDWLLVWLLWLLGSFKMAKKCFIYWRGPSVQYVLFHHTSSVLTLHLTFQQSLPENVPHRSMICTQEETHPSVLYKNVSFKTSYTNQFAFFLKAGGGWSDVCALIWIFVDVKVRCVKSTPVRPWKEIKK